MGTSLTVYPFAKLPELVPEDCPRLLLNLDHVGGWGSRVNDVACLMPCDKAVRELCKKLGWEEELDKLWEGTALSTEGPAETETAKEKVDEVVEELAEIIGTVKLEDKGDSATEGVGSKEGPSKPGVEAKEVDISERDTEHSASESEPPKNAKAIENIEVVSTTEKGGESKESKAGPSDSETVVTPENTNEREDAASEDKVDGREDAGGKQ